ncbi:AbiV family abortive infection protein [Comamonas terrigena]|uniref:AbiV family abortive infection protein n=1 Tax=Comamonas terrigena TaxID=32013 RepID=UPI00244B31F9|nr:AbiV family abortive infection protein [Comamonas terrigena]MDH0050771.1 AbiV family abortive infection protein [Comamonas terrigena]MDH0513173.1 AbiV family abortive infection protein [Comamonas terrigena]MDH1093106.1 AbiV family abortive infection protein [Comamonas terrigena]MDH1292294.1 AbiV family abortive infection protein [Comamonas terrigena]MDH1500584.1 AbiV family abortive infection protein [Comamonas terrigena]
MQKKLNAYRGKLSAAEVAKGMTVAGRNARRLADDAATLLAAGSFPTAASLAALAIEEAGKPSILRALALARNDAEIKDEWRAYRSHANKNVTWILPELAAAGARKLDDLRPLFDQDSDHPFLLDQLKQLGFYTDCLSTGHWTIPTKVIGQSLARILVKVADVLAKVKDVSEKEIELWIEHIGPAWKKDPALMKKALVNWYSAMQTAGLAPEGENKMEQFIHHGV